MLLVRTIIGDAHDARFATRRVERFLVSSADASKRRLRGRTDAGTDLAVDLARGAYLSDGAVLDDDGERVVVVERKPEQALIVRLSAALDHTELIRQAVRLGHAFGNQHVPVEVEGEEVRIAITTSQEIAVDTVSALRLDGAEIAIELVTLGRQRPPHGHAHHQYVEGHGMKATAFLSALQLSDSAFPIGRFAHSYGLEELLSTDATMDESTIVELVESIVLEAVAPLDGVAVAWAHRLAAENDLAGLLALDRAVTIRKITPSSRRASTACGRRLAALVPLLTKVDTMVALADHINARDSDGNLAIVEGALAQAFSIGLEEAVLLELRGTAVTLLSAALRLGRISATQAQAAAITLAPALSEGLSIALVLPVEAMRSVAPELEIAAMTHDRRDAKLFAT